MKFIFRTFAQKACLFYTIGLVTSWPHQINLGVRDMYPDLRVQLNVKRLLLIIVHKSEDSHEDNREKQAEEN